MLRTNTCLFYCRLIANNKTLIRKLHRSKWTIKHIFISIFIDMVVNTKVCLKNKKKMIDKIKLSNYKNNEN